MDRPDWKGALGEAFAQAVSDLDGLPERPVGPPPTARAPRGARRRAAHRAERPPGRGRAPRGAEDGLLPSGSGRFFGFVFGGATPAALAADWLTTAWDQNAGLYAARARRGRGRGGRGALAGRAARPAADVVGRLRHRRADGELHRSGGRPARACCGRAGWDVERDGPDRGARRSACSPASRAARHDRPGAALPRRWGPARSSRSTPTTRGGCGPTRSPRRSTTDGPGDRVRAGRQRQHRRRSTRSARSATWRTRPAPGCTSTAPSGCGRRPARRCGTLVDGVDRADSWATDAHKWLNVPYDSGLVFCAHPEAHRAAMSVARGVPDPGTSTGERDALDCNPEFSRRARGFAGVRRAARARAAPASPSWSTGAARWRAGSPTRLGATHGRRGAERRRAQPGAGALPADDDDELTRAVVERVQRDGTCWMQRHHLAGPGRDAHLGLQLDDRRGGHRPLGRGHPALRRGEARAVDRVRAYARP